MSSENNAPPAITPKLTVPRPDTITSTATRPDAGSTPPPPPPPPGAGSNGAHGSAGPANGTSGTASDPGDGMEVASGESRVAVARAGAVKAAAAALAAAKSAAKKVSATVPAAPPEQAEGTGEIDDSTVRRASSATAAGGADPVGAPAGQGTGASSMHYSAAGVTGTATPLAGSSASPATGATPAVRTDGPRRVRLSVSRVDPWSAMKLGFLLAVAIGIMTVVATAVVWYVLDGMLVFQKVQDFVTQIAGEESNVDMLQFVEFGRVISIATLLGVVNVVIITALSTIMAFLYNIVAALVGGVHLTLTDD